MARITVRGPRGPATSYLFEQGLLRVGRAEGNDLVVDDPALSRFHVELRRTARGWRLRDLGSRNGSRVNGRRVEDEVELADGDEVQLGDTSLRIGPSPPGSLHEGAAAETAADTCSSRGSGSGDGAPPFLGRAPAVKDLLARLRKLAASDISVLIAGESGTGKEILARLVHHHSTRADRPFVVVNCPALPASLLEAELFGVEAGVATGVQRRAGWFETAHGGTLFLDEIGDLDAPAQAKVLRAIQERTIERVGGRSSIEVDVRFVAATHHDLAEDVKSGSFRRDLYHRINAVTLHVPPLRERKEDIPLLVEHFLSQPGPAVAMSPEAMAALQAHDWPGNVRELERVVEASRALASGPVILPDALPLAPPVRAGAGTPPGVDAVAQELRRRIVEDGESFWDVVHRPFLDRELSRAQVRRFVERAHEEAGGSYREMARRLGVEDEYRRLLHFLSNHDVGVRR